MFCYFDVWVRDLLSEVLLKIDVSLKGEIDVKMRDNLEYATKCSGKWALCENAI